MYFGINWKAWCPDFDRVCGFTLWFYFYFVALLFLNIHQSIEVPHTSAAISGAVSIPAKLIGVSIASCTGSRFALVKSCSLRPPFNRPTRRPPSGAWIWTDWLYEPYFSINQLKRRNGVWFVFISIMYFHLLEKQ